MLEAARQQLHDLHLILFQDVMGASLVSRRSSLWFSHLFPQWGKIPRKLSFQAFFCSRQPWLAWV
jgi:hypothetical protein